MTGFLRYVRREFRRQRDAEIVRRYTQDGAPLSAIAAQMHMSIAGVYRIVKASGATLRRPGQAKGAQPLKGVILHAPDIVRRRLAGETLESIAADYGVTRERIRQIENKVGAHEAVKSKEERRRAEIKAERAAARKRAAEARRPEVLARLRAIVERRLNGRPMITAEVAEVCKLRIAAGATIAELAREYQRTPGSMAMGLWNHGVRVLDLRERIPHAAAATKRQKEPRVPRKPRASSPQRRVTTGPRVIASSKHRDAVLALKAEGLNLTQIIARLGISGSTVHGILAAEGLAGHRIHKSQPMTAADLGL
jgi:uncharacterized protein (DUF433 family)